MGLLDTLGNLTPEQTQGLLGFSANMLQAGGPSRMPVSFGQALGAGLQGYQGATEASRRQKLEEEQAKQITEMRALQIQEAQGSLQDKEAMRQQAMAAQKVAQQYQSGMGNPTAFAQGVLGKNLSPTVENSATLEAARAQQPASGDDEYSRRMGLANAYRANGLYAQADAAEQAALKFKPEFDQTPRQGAGADGKPFTYVLDKSGNVKRLDGVLPRDEMKLADLGGRQMAYNPYQITPGQSFNKTMTPGEVASNGIARERLNFDKSKEGKPVFNAELGGFVTPPSATQPGGALIPLAGGNRNPKMTEDQSKATGWLIQAENAFGNMKAAISKDPSASKPGINDAISAIPSLGIGEAIGNTFRGADRQMFLQGASSLSEALIRAATGAGVNKDEAVQKVREITPVAGDSDEVIAQKMAAIPLYLQSLKVRSGPGAGMAENVLAGAQPARKSAIKGQVIDGYRFKGGNPADQNSWEKI